MSNVYSKAIAETATRVQATNKKKMQSVALLAADKIVEKTLIKNKVDVARFDIRAIYATEKCIKIVHNVTRDAIDVAKLNANAFATIKTLVNARAANVTVSKRDIETAIDSAQKRDADTQAHVYQLNRMLSASTLAAQSQQCVDMIKTLKLVTEKTTNVFEVNDSALMQLFSDKYADIAI